MHNRRDFEANATLFDLSERWAARYRPSYTINLSDVRLPPPSYRGNNPYNGFTPEERILTDRVMIYLRREAILPKSSLCDLCGATDRIGYHGENYLDPFALIEVCFPCHMAIHRRFVSARSWLKRIELNQARAEQSGLAELPLKEPDFASWLRLHGRSSVICCLEPRSDQHECKHLQPPREFLSTEVT